MGKGGVGGSGGGGGGGGSGVTIGSGSAGTCFSGGAGSGGTGIVSNFSITTENAGINGGKGTAGFLNGLFSAYDSAGGAGNPGGDLSGAIIDLSGGAVIGNGTGGVLIVFVEGTITTAGSTVKHFTANGIQGSQTTSASGSYPSIWPFGGGSGGGIVIVVNNDAVSLGDNVQANGGIVVNNGPSGNYHSGGDGATYCVTFGNL